jgi:hypothetical protein
MTRSCHASDHLARLSKVVCLSQTVLCPPQLERVKGSCPVHKNSFNLGEVIGRISSHGNTMPD